MIPKKGKQMKKQKIIKQTTITIFLLFIFCLCGCGKQHISEEPDVVNSISFNRDENLTVVANCDVIKDKEEFAWKLIEMCRENSFHSIKFSTDRGYATSINMKVYLWRDEIDGQDAVMEIAYEPIDFGKDYNIVDHPDKFELYVDGELIEQK